MVHVAMVILAFHPLVWCAMLEILNGNGTYAWYSFKVLNDRTIILTSLFSNPNCCFTVRLMRQRQLLLILLQLWHHLARVVHVVVVQSLLLKWCYPKDVNGIASASSAKTVPRHLIQSLHAMVLTRIFIVELAMARNGDHMAMDLLVVLAFYKLMVRGSS